MKGLALHALTSPVSVWRRRRIVEVELGDQTLEMTSRTRTTGSRTRSLCRGRRYGGGWAKFDNFSFLKSNVDDLTLLTSKVEPVEKKKQNQYRPVAALLDTPLDAKLKNLPKQT